ncbi:24-methylenesterol C-methyltransferase 2 [Triticum urartu]|uniref:24-methylenesterol C-methyltransferase 2 n=1 Tax=Triticum urartu TaxID=4572 RepID=M7Z5W2_TRIUA|nr:24-methylenesterol C-methyltransferase 2 [Triticum urartu]
MAWTLAAAGFALVYWFVWVMGAAEVQGKRAVDLQMGSIADDKVGDSGPPRHAPGLQDVYGEVFRVLKPGGLYVSYEWVTTPLYRADDPEHVEAIHGIERGDALPGLRRQDEIAAVAKEVGFEVVKELDLALPPALPWWTRLKMGRLSYWRNSLVIRALTLLRVAPKGVSEVHEMLYETAHHLTRGGETGIFTPMHMVLLRKPAAAAE